MSAIIDKAPRYARIAQDLLAAIDRGAYPVGSMLPTEAELCKQFEVSSVTIRGALQELALRSVISRQPGVGTRVALTVECPWGSRAMTSGARGGGGPAMTGSPPLCPNA